MREDPSWTIADGPGRREVRTTGGGGRRRARTAAAAFLAVMLPACGGPPPPPATEVQAVWLPALPDDGEDAAWREIPVYLAEMLPQDLVDPRLLRASTPRAGVQAAHDGSRVAFRIAWDDATQNERPGPARFSDACAIQVPQRTEPDLPDPQMGNPGRPVEIAYWRASWQAASTGGADTITSLYPGAVVDHYPFEAPSLPPGSAAQQQFEARYSPAEALGARREGPRQRLVEDLVAEGPGTLRPAERMISEGGGRRTPTGWEVLIVRPLPNGLAPGGRSQVALGIWEGANGEVGARKMRSAWVPLVIEARAQGGGASAARGSGR